MSTIRHHRVAVIEEQTSSSSTNLAEISAIGGTRRYRPTSHGSFIRQVIQGGPKKRIPTSEPITSSNSSNKMLTHDACCIRIVFFAIYL